MEMVHIINADGKPVPVKLVGETDIGGGITGKNVENNEQVSEVSFEKDDKGYPVLRIIDAAPFAYDPVLGVTKTSLVAQKKLMKLDLSSSDVVKAGTNLLTEIKPPSGKVWKVENIFFRYRDIPGATSGTHQVAFRYGENYSYCGVLRGSTAFSKNIDFNYNSFSSSVDSSSPATETLQSDTLKGLYLSEEAPLYVYYQNQTDADQNLSRPFYLVYSEEDSL